MTHYILRFLALTLVVACGNNPSNTNALEDTAPATGITLTKEQFAVNGFTLDTLTERPFPQIVEASGMIDVPPQNKAVITALLGGFVKKAFLLVGDEVKKGQPLVTLENPEFVKLQQAYLDNFQQLDFLKAEYERQKTLYDEQITSQKNYLKAQSDYERAFGNYQGLKKQLQLLNISTSQVERQILTSEVTLYAPINGSITKMAVFMGSYVSPASEIMEIVDNDHIHLELTVFEKDILSIKKGQKILFKIPEASNETFTATVHLVGTSIDDIQRTIKVHGHLDDEENHGLLMGMFVEAKIIAASTVKPSLREESVIEVEGVPTALVLKEATAEGYHFEKMSLTVEGTEGGYTATGLPVGDSPKVFLGKGAFNMLAEE
ncbi:MAG: efflux RND transporter periplasmic adaptor subunit [Flavobacteriaceae bacterium]